jgi:hypothetical protein
MDMSKAPTQPTSGQLSFKVGHLSYTLLHCPFTNMLTPAEAEDVL